MWSRRNSTFESKKATITENYQVVHSLDATQDEIYNAPGLSIGDSFLEWPDVRLINGAISQVTPIYSILTFNYEGNAPAADAVTIQWSGNTSDTAIDQDFNGSPIVTNLGEPIEGVTMLLADQVLTVSRKFISINTYAANEYLHSVNSDTFYGYPPGMAKLKSYSATTNTEQQDWDVTAVIEFRYPYRTTPAKAWWSRVRHEGYYCLSPVDGDYGRALDSYQVPPGPGEPSVRPILLKQTGEPETNPNNAYWKEFQLYNYLPYNALGLV
jgi:hypothetical protein